MELLLEKNMFMSDEEVAVMVASRSQGEAMVDRVGTVTDIPASKLWTRPFRGCIHSKSIASGCFL